jgi:hypothetical protein
LLHVRRVPAAADSELESNSTLEAHVYVLFQDVVSLERLFSFFIFLFLAFLHLALLLYLSLLSFQLGFF